MSVTGIAFADATTAGAVPADTAARRAVVALMLAGIALDAFVAPAAAVVAAPVRVALHAGDVAMTSATVAFNALYYVGIVLSLWAAATLGKKRYVAASFVGFALASIVCLVAPNAPGFVAGRALQGLTLGGVFVTSLLTFAATAPKRDLAIVFAIFAFLALATPNAAPWLAGTITAFATWRAVFALFAVVAVGIAVAILQFMRDPTPARTQSFDPISGATVVLTFASFSFFVERAGATAFADPGAMLALLVAIAAGVIFVYRQATSTAPFVDVGIVRSPIIARGLAVCVLLGVVIASGEVQLQYARSILHLESAHASSILALRIAGIAIGGAGAAWLGQRGWENRLVVSIGFVVLCCAFIVQGAVTAMVLGEVLLGGVMLAQGVGFALVMGPLGSLLFAAVPPASMAPLVVFFKLAVGIGDAFAAPLVAAFLAVETLAARIPAWSYADVWAATALIAAIAAVNARALTATAR